MALAIATNTGALMAAASATSVNRDMETSMERLSTGKRLNSASDDAAGVAIASRLTSEIRGTNQAIRNAQDGQALINTAEGAHKEIENILQRMRELAVQSANDTNDSSDRANLQSEMSALTTEIDRIAEATTWAGQKLLNGTGGNNGNGSFVMQVGGKTSTENQITAAVKAMTSAALGIGAGGVSASADANAASLTEVGNHALQISGTPAKGDMFNFTVGGTTTAGVFSGGLDMAVRLGTVADTPAVTVPSVAGTNDTAMSFVDGTLTVTAGTGADGGDNFIVTINGTDVEVATSATDNPTAVAGKIETAIAAKNFGTGIAGVTVTNDNDGILTLQPKTTFEVSVDGGVTFAAATTFDGDADGSVSGGVSGAVASVIAAAINSKTATNFVGLTATAGSDGSVTLDQAINFSASTFTNDAASSVTGEGSLNTAGTVLTFAAFDGAEAFGFSINGASLTFAVSTTDAYDDTVAGQVARINDEIALTANATKLSGLTLVASASSDGKDILITATAKTTDLIADITTVTASATAATTATGLSVASAASSRLAIDAIDTAIQSVNGQRSSLGAISNRLDSTVSNLTNVAINLEGGKGRIEDADFAAESTNLAKSQILAQASTAMLAQANASKQSILSLLQG